MSRYEYPNKSYYAYNETFVDDEGLEVYQNELRKSQYLCQEDDIEDNDDEEIDSRRSFRNDNNRYQAVDQYDDRLDYLNLSMREPPLGEGSSLYHHQQQQQQQQQYAEAANMSRDNKQQQQQPAATKVSPSKHRYEVINHRRHRSSSVPSRRRIPTTQEPNILEPMIVQAGKQLQRSQSTIIPQTRHRLGQQVRDYQRRPQMYPTPYTTRVNSQTETSARRFKSTHAHMFLSPAEQHQQSDQNSTTTMGQNRNLAVISPNYRQDIIHSPLLANSPMKLQFIGGNSSPNKTPSSWSSQRLPTEPLWFAGLILLFTGGASCLLCLYILSKNGRKYFLDFGAISGFVCLMLGMIGCRTSRWLPHRHYVTGYILLSAFSLLQCGILAVLASDSKQLDNNIVDIAGGAVCGLSALSIVLATLGFLTSACCNLPPPDSRVSHSVQGFTV